MCVRVFVWVALLHKKADKQQHTSAAAYLVTAGLHRSAPRPMTAVAAVSELVTENLSALGETPEGQSCRR